LSPIWFNLYSEYLTKEAVEKFGDFKMEEQVIWTVKYADDLVLLAKGKTVLLRMIDRLMEIGRCYEMEMNVEKIKIIRIWRYPSPVQIMIDQKEPDNVEYFKYFGNRIINDERCTHKIKSRIAIALAAIKRRRLFSLAN